jgi:hypothetical protein
MKKEGLQAGQRRLVELVQSLAFGYVGGLRFRNGLPVFEPPPRIVQTIKLSSGPGQRDSNCTDPALKAEFLELFYHLARLRDGSVDIEVRHGLPFRIVLEWPASRLGHGCAQ